MLSRALVSVFALSCAQESATLPATTPQPHAPLPMPDTAFSPPADERPPQAQTSAATRFDTRRIGPPGDAAPTARYRGAPVDLDLKNAELSNVFRLLADVGHVNIVVEGEVTGTITMRLKRVPWDQALELVATTRNLDLRQEGNVIVVRTAGKH